MRCDICGSKIGLAHSWPGTRQIFHACIGGNDCNQKLAQLLGLRYVEQEAKFGFPEADGTIWVPPDVWWWPPNPNEHEPHSMQIDAAMRELSRVPSRVTYGEHANDPHGQDFLWLNPGSKYEVDACAVCKTPHAVKHTFEATDGFVYTHLCHGTCDGDVLEEWQKSERNFLCATKSGVLAAVKACEARRTHAPEWLLALPDMLHVARNPGRPWNDFVQGVAQHFLPEKQTPIPMKAHSSLLAHESSDRMPTVTPDPALCPKTPRNTVNTPPAQAHAGDLGKLPGPASEESRPLLRDMPGICHDCREHVHSAAPARDGRWYCESCVGWRTYMEDTAKRIERIKAQLAEDLNRLPPMPRWRPKVLQTGDLSGPKVGD